MPRHGRTRVLVSCAAGFGEELNYRGVLVNVLWAATGSWWIAAGLSALAFSVAHASQSWRTAAFVAVFSIAFQASVAMTGSLLPGMLAHAACDIVAGVVFGHRTRGLADATPPST